MSNFKDNKILYTKKCIENFNYRFIIFRYKIYTLVLDIF